MLQAENEQNIRIKAERNAVKIATKAGKRWSEVEEEKLLEAKESIVNEVAELTSNSISEVENALLTIVVFQRGGWRQQYPAITKELKPRLEALANEFGRTYGSVKSRLQARLEKENKNNKTTTNNNEDNEPNEDNGDNDDKTNQQQQKKEEDNNVPRLGAEEDGEKERKKRELKKKRDLKKRHEQNRLKKEKEKEETKQKKQKKEKEEEEKELLGPEQQRVVDAVIIEKKSVFFTGAAGTGKSYLLRHIIKLLREQEKKVAVCASTGFAACHIGGVTIHKFAGLGPYDEDTAIETLISRTRMRKVFAERWRAHDVLVIDEISMVSSTMYDLLEGIATAVRHNKQLPFGGMQIICCGDFFQLPPVTKNGGPIPFAFKAKRWSASLDLQIELKTIYRQSDPRLINLLNDIRIGQCSPETKLVLLQHTIKNTNKTDKTNQKADQKIDQKDERKEEEEEEISTVKDFEDGIVATRLFSHRKSVV